MKELRGKLARGCPGPEHVQITSGGCHGTRSLCSVRNAWSGSSAYSEYARKLEAEM